MPDNTLGSIFNQSDYDFGVLQQNGYASYAYRHGSSPMGDVGFIDQGVRHFDGKKWVSDKNLRNLFPENQASKHPAPKYFVDLDGAGACVMIDANGKAHRFDPGKDWQPLGFALPADALKGGVRFLDLTGNGKLDLVFSNEKAFGVYRFTDMKTGWTKQRAGKPGDANAIPMIARTGTNNGCSAHSGELWWANEDTVLLKNHVDRRAFKDLARAK